MAEAAVSDTSPLIVLARGNQLELLRVAGHPIAVPDAVVDKILRRGAADPAVEALRITRWLEVVERVVVPDRVQRYRLGRGEEAVLAWVLAHPGALAIMDDLRGRRAARELGIPVVGTLGLIVEAKRRGLIPAARPLIDHLQRVTDWYLADEVRDAALRRIDE